MPGHLRLPFPAFPKATPLAAVSGKFGRFKEFPLLRDVLNRLAGPGWEALEGTVPAASKNSLASLTTAATAGQQRFAVYPSCQQPRWIIPLENSRSARLALDLYAPYRIKGKLAK